MRLFEDTVHLSASFARAPAPRMRPVGPLATFAVVTGLTTGTLVLVATLVASL
ncbi:MAG: hypothetical protein AB7K04_12040 [Pseudorhodoplanes sp.]